jgi:TetR/AcrR family transcriptional repressor of bet genes
MPKKIDHQARRREIAQAAVTVIGVSGIDNTRLMDVAKAARVTTGAITHYFEGKDSVMLAALDHVAQNIFKILRLQSNEVADRDTLIEMAAEALPTHEEGARDWRVWLAFFGRAMSDPSLARVNNAYYDEIRDRLAAIIARYQAQGQLARRIDPTTTADSIITAVDGLGVRATIDPESWPPERQKRQLRAILTPLLPTE